GEGRGRRTVGAHEDLLVHGRDATPPRLFGGPGLGELDRWRLDALDGAEDDLVVLDVDDDGGPGPELLPEDALRQRVFDQALDGAPEGSGTELGVVTPLGQQLLGGVGELEAQALALQLVADPLDHEVDDLLDLV